MPNFRYTARGRPHSLQRLSLREENLGFLSAFAIFDLLAICHFHKLFSLWFSSICVRHPMMASFDPDLLNNPPAPLAGKYRVGLRSQRQAKAL